MNDAMYILQTKQRDIVAAVRLTRSKSDEHYTFLRALCCARDYRRQGLASHLIHTSLAKFDSSWYYCFASSHLVQLYECVGFEQRDAYDDGDTHTVPKWMMHAYQRMANRWDQTHKGASLCLFTKQHRSNVPLQVILLQHCQEANKSTATGWLADDDVYNQAIRDIQPFDVPLHPRIHIQNWVWSGRDDTAAIEERLKQLTSTSVVYLLWTDHPSHSNRTNTDESTTYIVLDGTWQQAQTMFRKIPMLWNLPRISLTGIPPSKYTLRKDYTGWRERFSTNQDGGALLCTAEVMSALLHRNGDCIGANEIRTRLDVFQRNYPKIAARRKGQ